MLRDFGGQIADAVCVIPPENSNDAQDINGLRVSVLKGDTMSLLCLNNHQRHWHMNAKKNLNITVQGVRFPAIDLEEDETILYPFSWQFEGCQIDYATAQPLCRIQEQTTTTLFFWNYRNHMELKSGDSVLYLKQGVPCSLPGGNVKVILLSRMQAEQAWKFGSGHAEQLFLTDAGMLERGGSLEFYGLCEESKLLTYPSNIQGALFKQTVLRPIAGDAFYREPIHFDSIPSLASERSGAIYRFVLPQYRQEGREAFLNVDFAGNIANLYHNGIRVADWFYTGEAWRVGLEKFQRNLEGEWILQILPLRKDMDIYLEKHPVYNNGEVCILYSLSLEYRYRGKCNIHLGMD